MSLNKHLALVLNDSDWSMPPLAQRVEHPRSARVVEGRRACLAQWVSPHRQRAHAALLARDGQISSAASVAALLGRNDIDHVKAEAQRKFYGVELSQVRLEDMQQSTPDPALFARARHARFDEIDWFISHSWHDSPDAKYSALQAARTTFVAAVWKSNFRRPTPSTRRPVTWQLDAI